ncbi:bifunctional dethiobiotin synthetase / adenosylmethionine---8-amino-7-oxononanoate aminotransferase, partial [Phenoliferia sp. Uapishka_3]
MLARHLRTHLILAPSTSIGKSVFATGLCRTSLALGERTAYLKPVGTGSGDGDDEAHVGRFAPGITTKCLYHFDEPVSPHLAAQRAGASSSGSGPTFPTDAEFARSVAGYASEFAGKVGKERGALYIESAGGVHSPTLAGTSQLDAYRPLLPPTILVASSELGGISTTISAYESLHIRGYDVDAVLVFREDYYRNFEYFAKWFAEKGIPLGVIDKPPPVHASPAEDVEGMKRYYAEMESGPLRDVVAGLQERHVRRIADLETAPGRALDSVWWPFCQHGLVTEEKDVMVIDSAHGDFFSVLRPTTALSSPLSSLLAATSPSIPSTSLLQPMLDGSASWWTQCLGHGNPDLTLAAAYAAGRYGHILFPTAISEPSLTLAERLLRTVGDKWASRVFYSDDGTTGMELALKMALRAFAQREGLGKVDGRELAVLGLKGSYHGDTMGAMDACEANVYNEKVDWHRGRGFWLDPPTVRIEDGKPVVAEADERTTFGSLSEVYDVDRRIAEQDPLVEVYRTRIEREIGERLARGDGMRFGTLILEPVVMGAGGMIFVDPLFQRVLIDTVRTNRLLFPSTSSPILSSSTEKLANSAQPVWQGLPIIFDEVFVGLYRLGRPTTSTFLGANVHPDLACYAKILTGGLVPMAVTLASDAIFRAFWGQQKVDALLHGHSYTAHPIGCTVANRTLDILENMKEGGAWSGATNEWKAADELAITSVASESTSSPAVWSFWSNAFITNVSSLPNVDGAMAIGCVLAIHLSAADSAGYQSTASEAFLRRLRYGAPLIPDSPTVSPAGSPFNIHARPLGNVVYWMASLNSDPSTLRAIEAAILDALK